MNTKENLRQQIMDSAANVLYTYAAHWNIVNRLKKRQKHIKIVQIVLTTLSTGGILTSLISNTACLSMGSGWVSALTSAIALGLNLYTLNFKEPESIENHTDAANELWDVREAYRSLLTDFDDLDEVDIRKRRDELTAWVGRINKNYSGTDEDSFSKAQKEIGKYEFGDREAEKLLHISRHSKK